MPWPSDFPAAPFSQAQFNKWARGATLTQEQRQSICAWMIAVSKSANVDAQKGWKFVTKYDNVTSATDIAACAADGQKHGMRDDDLGEAAWALYNYGLNGRNTVNKSPVDSAKEAFNGAANVVDLLKSTDFWTRAGEVMVGGILLAVGANALFKNPAGKAAKLIP